VSTDRLQTTLLDVGALPVAELARIAMREGVRPRDVYQAHKWFARRFAVTARALLVGAACPVSASFWRSFYRGDHWVGRTVLDPFVGGGVMLLEAGRLGAAVRGVDVEPVAAAIARFQATLRDLPDLAEPLAQLSRQVGAQLEPFYVAQDHEGRRERLLHAFWVQSVRCGTCANTFDAHPRYRLAWSEADRRQWVACSGCSDVLEASLDAERVVCRCGGVTETGGGRIDRGSAACPGCGQREQLIAYARRSGGPPRFRLFAVETLPEGEERRVHNRARRLRAATEFDLGRYASAEQRLHELLRAHPGALPLGLIPTAGRSDNRLIDYGYEDYAQLFNARQQLHLALLGAAIRKLKGPVRDGLAIAFSDHLTTNNMQCGYAGGWRRLTPLFSIRAYRHIARPVEINPWLQRNGRGTFPNAVRAVVRASDALKDPKEVRPGGGVKRVRDAAGGEVDVVCGDARRMTHIPSGSIDLVLTDPPYFDYISYSELGHFFTPWMRRFGLIGGRAQGGFPKGQLASPSRSIGAERRFARKLADVFREIRRVCKPEARVVFTYQNLDGRGWNAIGLAMSRAGIEPLTTFPLYGDSSASLHKHEQSISWDAVMVCRLGVPDPTARVRQSDRESATQFAAAWSKRLAASGHHMTAGDRINMAHAAAIVEAFGRSADAPSRTGTLSASPRRRSR
jgi:adenine-specific DNA methylase